MKRRAASLTGRLPAVLLLLLAFPLPAQAQASETFALALPVKCQLGVSCFVQNYVDHDPTGQVRDFMCSGRTYDGHDGTDIRIPDLQIQQGNVDVLAAAPGRVVAIRDGVDDVSIRVTGKAAVAGKECGNGIVIEHEGDWRTQYCHLARGSVRVKVGDHVVTGQSIGLVGLSGATEFPHLHFTLRHRGQIVDPFAHGAPAGACGGGQSLWAGAIKEQTRYRAREILNFGFSSLPPTMELVESGDLRKHPVRPEFGCLQRLRSGDWPAGRRSANHHAPGPGRDHFLRVQGRTPRPGQSAIFRRVRETVEGGSLGARPLQGDLPRDQRRTGNIWQNV